MSSVSVDFSPTPLNVGNRATQTITLSNSSSSELSLTFKIGGANAADFKLVLPPADAQTSTQTSSQTSGSAQPPSAEVAASTAAEVASTPCGISGTALLASGQNCSLSISFQPQAPGALSASLAIGTSESSRPQLIPLTGKAVTGNLTLSPTELDFPQTVPGIETAPLFVLITNGGIAPVTIAAIGTSDAKEFPLNGFGDCPAPPLPPLAHCSIPITFKPTVISSFEGTYSVTDSFGETYYVDLSGTGVPPPPIITVTPTSLTFPDTAIGLLQSDPKFVTVTNAGLGVVTGITVDESDPDTFHVSSHDCRGAALKPGESCQILVEFVPSTVGAHNATITVGVTGSLDLPHIVKFSGTGVRESRELTFTPSTLDFPNSLVHAPFTKIITVTSTGTFPITIGLPSIAGGPSSEGFTADDTSCRSFRLLPGQTCQVQVEFFPNTLGPHAATLTLDSDATGLPRTVTLTGDAVPPKKALTLSPSPLDFGETPFGVPGTAPRLLTITNTGNVPVALLGTPAISGANAGDFQVAEASGGLPCVPGSLGAGEACTSQVRFVPQALGDRTATITIASDADVPTQPVSLIGKGVPATRILSISPPKLDFPNTNPGSHNLQFLGIANTGNSSVNISRIVLDPTSDFTITDESSCPLSLGMIQPGTGCIVALVFSPAAVGSRSSSVSIFSDAGSGLQTVPLSGNGVAEATRTLTVTPALNFDDTNIGRESFENTIQLANTGTADITGVAVSENGDTHDFFQRGISLCTGTLTVGASCFMDYAFSPRAAGPRKAILTVTGDQASNSPQSVLTGNGVVGEPKTITVLPTELDFHSSVVGVASAPQTVTITNVGTDAVSIQGISLTQPAQKEFAIVANNCPTLLSPNTSCKVLVTFTPFSPFVVREAGLDVESDAPTLNTNVFSVLKGTGPVRTISIVPFSLTFPPTTVGSSSAPQTATIKNTGIDTITFGTVEVTGDGGDFSYFPDCPSTLDPGQSCSITIQFAPLGTGPKTALVRSGFQDLTGPQPLLAISGTGLANGPVLQSITIAPSNPTVTAGATQQFTATGHFSDRTTQDLTATVTWTSSTPANATISATGLAAAIHAGTSTISATSGAVSGSTLLTATAGTKALTVSPTALTFPAVPFGSTTASQDVTLTSTGTFAVTVSSNLINGANPSDFILTASTCTTIVNPGTNCTYSFAFRPLAAGHRSATLNFFDDAPDSPQTVSLVGGDPAPTFTIGGTISGLLHNGLVLANGSDTLSIAASATDFAFATAVASGTPYSVTAATQPVSETCSITNGTGTVASADVTSVQVTCLENGIANWVWMDGDATVPNLPSFGTIGVADPSNKPGARDQAFRWIDRAGNLWMFGGIATDLFDQHGQFNDFWKYDVSTGLWTRMGGPTQGNGTGTYGTMGTPSTSNFPPSRLAGVSWTDASRNFWLFGGSGYDSTTSGPLNNDLWRYNPDTGEWTWISGESIGSHHANYGVKGVADPANQPGGRELAASWVDADGNLWLFGGDGSALGAAGFPSAGRLNDLWKYTPTTNEWTWMGGSQLGSNDTVVAGVYGSQGVPSVANLPGQRNEAMSWADNDGNFWLFGGVGYDASGHVGLLNDLWRYKITTGEWTWIAGANTVNSLGSFGTKGISSPTNAPEARHRGVTWTDADGVLWLLGGDAVQARRNDLWRFDIPTGQWTWVSGSSDVGVSSAGISGVGVSGVYGTKGVPDSASMPGARSAGVAWVDRSGNLWLFGGLGNDSAGNLDYLNDLWKYTR